MVSHISFFGFTQQCEYLFVTSAKLVTILEEIRKIVSAAML